MMEFCVVNMRWNLVMEVGLRLTTEFGGGTFAMEFCDGILRWNNAMEFCDGILRCNYAMDFDDGILRCKYAMQFCDGIR